MHLAIGVKEAALIDGKVCADIASGYAGRVPVCILAPYVILVQTRLSAPSASVCLPVSGGTSAGVFVSVVVIAASLSAVISMTTIVVILLAVRARAISVHDIPVSAVRVASVVVRGAVSVARGTIFVPKFHAAGIGRVSVVTGTVIQTLFPVVKVVPVKGVASAFVLVPILTVGVGPAPVSTVAVVVMVVALVVVVVFVVLVVSRVVAHDGWMDE